MSEIITVATINLFTPFEPRKYVAPQAERIPAIVAKLRRISPDRSSWILPDVVFVSELEEENMALLGRCLGMTSLGTCVQPVTGEINALFVNERISEGTTGTSDTAAVGSGSFERRALVANIAGVQITGVHYHWGRTARAELDRLKASSSILDSLEPSKPAIVLGDFNTFRTLPSRAIFERFGLASMARGCKDDLRIPTPEYAAVELATWERAMLIPFGRHLQVDDIYTNLRPVDVRGGRTETDHPVFIARLQVPQLTL